MRSFVWGLDLSGSAQGAGGVGGLLAATTYNQSPLTYLPVFDGNGNVTGLIDSTTGTRSATYVHGPFGESIAAYGTAAAASPFRFSTKYTDAETGQLYYGFRYYNPSTQRWLSRDPIGERGGANLYGFVGNDPIRKWDKLGLKCDCDDEMRKACAMIDAVIQRFQNLVALHEKALGEVSTMDGWLAYRDRNNFGIGGYAFTGATEETQNTAPKPITSIVNSVELRTGIGRFGFWALTGVTGFFGGLVIQDWDLAEATFTTSVILQEKYLHAEALRDYREFKARCTACGL